MYVGMQDDPTDFYGLLKAELTRRGISYDMLQEKLSNLEIQETANSINVKINRGAFSFVFFFSVQKL